MKYILAPHIDLIGYDKLPFCLFNWKTLRTSFLTREEYSVILDCDGKTELDPESLDETKKWFFDALLEEKVVVPAEDGQTLAPHQEYVKYNNRFKNEVHWSITGDCNYRCKHCFMSAPDAKFGVLPTDKILELIEQMAQCGIKYVSITGGEPLIRKDFWTIIDSLREHRIAVSSILTNGALVSSALLDGFDARKMCPSFQISFDGLGFHDWLRGIDGAEEKAKRAFALLKERGYSFSVGMSLFRDNLHTLRDTINYLAQAGCQSVKVNMARSTGEWIHQGEQCLSFEEGMQAYLDYIPQYFADGAPLPIMLDGAFRYEVGAPRIDLPYNKHALDKPDKQVMCDSHKSMVYISPEGKVLPCQEIMASPLFDEYPNLFDTSLQQVLSDSRYIKDACSTVQDFMDHNPECKTCSYLKNCHGGCRASAVGANGTDYLKPDQVACAYFKDGWFEKFRQVGDAAFEKYHESHPERFPEQK